MILPYINAVAFFLELLQHVPFPFFLFITVSLVLQLGVNFWLWLVDKLT